MTNRNKELVERLRSMLNDSHTATKTDSAATALHDLECKAIDAAIDGDLEELKALLPRLPDGVNTKDDDGSTLLLCAVDFGHNHIAKYLLQRGAAIEENSRGYTPTFVAAENGDEPCLKTLLGYDPNSMYGEMPGETPESIAKFKGYEQTLSLLAQPGSGGTQQVSRVRQPIRKQEESLAVIFRKTSLTSFIALCRGLHFYQSNFSNKDINQILTTSQLNRSHCASTSMPYFRETERISAQQEARLLVNNLRKSGDKHEIHQMYVNSYRGFMEHCQLVRNPFFSCSDQIETGLKYAYGVKHLGSESPGIRKINYLTTGIPVDEFLGVFYVYVIPKAKYDNLEPYNVIQHHERGAINIKYRNAPEGEITLVGGIASEYNVYQEIVTLPRFDSYNHDRHSKFFGLSLKDFNYYKDRLCQFNSNPKLQLQLINLLIKGRKKIIEKCINDYINKSDGRRVFHSSSGYTNIEGHVGQKTLKRTRAAISQAMP